MTDIFGKTCIDYIAESKHTDNMNYLLDNKLLLSNNLLHIDKAGKSLFSKLLAGFPAMHMQFTELLTDEVLNVKDSMGITNLGHIIIHSEELLEYYLSSKLSKAILDEPDNNGRTCTMIAAQYNGDNLKLLLKSEYIKTQHLMLHKNIGSCLTATIKYCPKLIRFVLDSDKMTAEIMDSKENEKHFNTIISMNIVQLACKHNPEALMFLISSKYNITDHINETVGKSDDMVNAFKLAIIYQPECVEILLKSKYYTDEMINNTNNIMTKSCALDALDMQPLSFIKLAKSGKFKHVHMIFGGHSPMDRIMHIYYSNRYDDNTDTQYEQVADDILKKCPTIKNPDQLCDSTDPDACVMCSGRKNKIFISPCNHKACITCSTRTYKCHMCRGQIAQRINYVD
jgi:hypothetical protein